MMAALSTCNAAVNVDAYAIECHGLLAFHAFHMTRLTMGVAVGHETAEQRLIGDVSSHATSGVAIAYT